MYQSGRGRANGTVTRSYSRPSSASRKRTLSAFDEAGLSYRTRDKQAHYRIRPMNARLLASDLGFPEGPVVFPDGRLVFCDGNIGELSSYVDDTVRTFAVTGGSPWGAVLGSDGAIYVTQGGNVPGSGTTSAVSGIQRVRSDGTVELLYSEVDGRT